VREDAADISRLRSIAVVGKGRLGGALSQAFRDAGLEVSGPLGRGEQARGDAVLLCVPDSEVAAAAAAATGTAPLVGHTSGATGLDVLESAEAFSLHPLQTVTAEGASFSGCGCAVAGSSPAALQAARHLASSLGMRPFEIADADRPAYHAAASIASNFVVTLLGSAESVAEGAGIPRKQAREMLAPLVETAVRNWAALGPERALTGPVARGDEATVDAQRAAVAARCPDLVALFDTLVQRTRAIASVAA